MLYFVCFCYGLGIIHRLIWPLIYSGKVKSVKSKGKGSIIAVGGSDKSTTAKPANSSSVIWLVVSLTKYIETVIVAWVNACIYLNYLF